MARDQVRRLTAALTGEVSRGVRLVATEVQAELIEATPIDTGFARASWHQSVGAPSQAEPDDVATAGAVQAAGAALVAAYRVELGDVHVQNNAEYIESLDQGHSQQAPTGFVRAAIERGVAAAVAKAGGRP